MKIRHSFACEYCGTIIVPLNLEQSWTPSEAGIYKLRVFGKAFYFCTLRHQDKWRENHNRAFEKVKSNG